MMGDYTQVDMSQMKAFTTFQVMLDYVNIMKEALTRCIDYKDSVEKIANIIQRTNANYDPTE